MKIIDKILKKFGYVKEKPFRDLEIHSLNHDMALLRSTTHISETQMTRAAFDYEKKLKIMHY